MAALPLCATWFPPSRVAVTWHSATPATCRVTHIHSLGRQCPSPLPIRIQARTQLRCPKAAAADRDRGLEQQQNPERGDDEHDAAASTEIDPFDLMRSNSYDIPEILVIRQFRKAFCATWLRREAPNMFPIEKDEISKYMMRISSHANVQDVNNKVLALYVCAEAQEALDLASIVMDLTYVESLDRGTIHLFDQDTADQVIRTCAPIFCHVAKAANLKSIETDTVLSFLDALRGLGAFCDTLFQQIVFKLKDGPRKNSISNTMGMHSRKFDNEMKKLEEQFVHSTGAAGIKHTAVVDTLSHGMKQAQSYILQMIPAQQYARRILDGGSMNKDDRVFGTEHPALAGSWI